MTIHSETVHTERYGRVGVIVVDNPPVNAIGPSVREGIEAAVRELREDATVEALVLHCAGSTFMAGADIRKLNSPPGRFTSAQVIQCLEDVPKPVVAALQGNALGGGLEFALGCHYRCATAGTTLGLPEVNLGLIPGAGGTQRLPRIVGIEKALDMIVSGKPISAAQAAEAGFVDRLIPGHDVLAEAVAYAAELLDKRSPPRRTREVQVTPVPDAVFAAARETATRTRRGEEAPAKAIDAIRAAATLTFEQGIERERQLFAQCRDSSQSRALRHMFLAERQTSKIPGIDKTVTVRPMQRIGIVGAGTMGRGIAMAFSTSGFEVVIVETDGAALQRGLASIRDTYAGSLAKGRMNAADMDACLARIRGAAGISELAEADLVIEAVFEDMALKKRVFAELDAVCRRGAILATNTSALDVDVIAAATSRPQDVIGLHFFSPAHVMRLLEVVRARLTSQEVIATSMDLARRLRKLGVLAGNCDGFIGNRMLAGYRREAEFLLLEGATPGQVDEALVRFGMSMGPNAMGDMAGLDIGAAGRKRRRAEGKIPDDPRFGVIGDRLVEAGRLGQKTGRGYYRYEEGNRRPLPDPEVQVLIEREAARLGIQRRPIGEQEIVERCMLPLINEAARILEEGIALRPGDIDVVWVNGYGFPRYRGGPLCYADEVGLSNIVHSLQRFSAQLGPAYWEPAPLLARLAAENGSFEALNQAS